MPSSIVFNCNFLMILLLRRWSFFFCSTYSLWPIKNNQQEESMSSALRHWSCDPATLLSRSLEEIFFSGTVSARSPPSSRHWHTNLQPQQGNISTLMHPERTLDQDPGRNALLMVGESCMTCVNGCMLCLQGGHNSTEDVLSYLSQLLIYIYPPIPWPWMPL